LFSTITKCVHVHFQIHKLEKELAIAEKELQQARKGNQALARYINAKKKKEEAQKKEEARKRTEEEARKKVMDGQSSNNVWT
jgi:predicted Holliday junction resolvase-like endonuclease